MNREAQTNPPKKINKQTLRRLLAYLGAYKFHLIVVFICIVASSISSSLAVLFIRTLIDDYIMPLLSVENPVFSGLLQALLQLGCIYLVGILATFVYTRIMVVVTEGTIRRIRDEMFSKMQSLPIAYFDSRTHGDIMSLYTNDADTLNNMISQSIVSFVSSITSILAVFFSMMSLSIWLSLVVIVLMFFILMAVGRITGRSGKYFVDQQSTLAELNGYVEEMIHGQKVVKVFNREEISKEEMRQKNAAWSHASSLANGYAYSMMPMMNAFGYLLYIVLALLGAFMAVKGIANLSLSGANLMTLGMIASFLTLSRNFISPISQIADQFNFIIRALAGAERIFAFLDAESEPDEGKVTLVNAKEEQGEIIECAEHTGMWAWKAPMADGSTRYIKLEGRVVLDHVGFSYVEGKQVLSDITLYAEPGQKVAFVGATGAGKTTITNLINRFYDIDDGKIRYDGININKIKKADLRRSLGVVLQDVHLFTGTVMENIRFGNPQASDEECIAAAKLANAHGFIRMLPEGYQTVLKGDGSRLSQGQRQLLSIARAAVSDPPVMVLDEATSSIDTRTEALVQSGMDKLMEGRTTFVIAHRLSTIKNADVIMVLENGKIIERGNHEKLLQEKGVYYQLYMGAFELE